MQVVVFLKEYRIQLADGAFLGSPDGSERRRQQERAVQQSEVAPHKDSIGFVFDSNGSAQKALRIAQAI